MQGELETTLARVLRIDPVSLTCAGRTDTGVHARGQVAHVDVPVPPAPDLAERLNRALPDDVVVARAEPAEAGFDARFSALWRRYVYRVCDQATSADPLTRRHVLRWRRPVSVELMGEACAALVGEHDFAAYCRPRVGGSTVRTLLCLDAVRRSELVELTVVADAFCHNMVRALVGALLAVGQGRLPVPEPARILAGRQRDSRVQVVPPHGLTLEEVGYPAPGGLATRAEQARARRGTTR